MGLRVVKISTDYSNFWDRITAEQKNSPSRSPQKRPGRKFEMFSIKHRKTALKITLLQSKHYFPSQQLAAKFLANFRHEGSGIEKRLLPAPYSFVAVLLCSNLIGPAKVCIFEAPFALPLIQPPYSVLETFFPN